MYTRCSGTMATVGCCGTLETVGCYGAPNTVGCYETQEIVGCCGTFETVGCFWILETVGCSETLETVDCSSDKSCRERKLQPLLGPSRCRPQNLEQLATRNQIHYLSSTAQIHFSAYHQLVSQLLSVAVPRRMLDILKRTDLGHRLTTNFD